jgi:hypothetical protein
MQMPATAGRGFMKEFTMSTQLSGFGPWSTALDNGTRMQLSAFWRQRMAGLARLPVGRRLSRRWAACAIMATLLLAAMPLVELSSRAIAEEKPSAAQEAASKADEEFVWRFSNGLEVELIGLTQNPSKGRAWWRPDGSSLKDVSLPQARYRSADGGARELAFRWRNVSDDPDQTRLWHSLPPYDGAGGGLSEKEPDGSILEVTGVNFNGGLKQTAITFTASVSATPWKKAFETDGRNAQSEGRMADGKMQSAAFTAAYEIKAGIAITASYGIGDRSGRLVLIDKSGKESLPTRQNGVGSTHFTQTTFQFDGVTLADVERFELQTQTRTMEMVLFNNVSLQAGHATKVVIEPYKVDRRGIETGYLPSEARVAITESDGKRIDRLPILGPITSGKEIVPIDPPSDEEILRVFNKAVGPSFLQQIGLTKKKELPLDQVAKIEKVKFEEKVDPSRVYPLIGEARQVHTLYMCELQLKDGKTHKLCVDHNHLHMTADDQDN